MEVYLLVNHEQQEAVQSESWTYVRLASDQQDAISILSDAYRHMSGLLQLVVLLSVYDNLPDSAVADLLECEETSFPGCFRKQTGCSTKHWDSLPLGKEYMKCWNTR